MDKETKRDHRHRQINNLSNLFSTLVFFSGYFGGWIIVFLYCIKWTDIKKADGLFGVDWKIYSICEKLRFFLTRHIQFVHINCSSFPLQQQWYQWRTSLTAIMRQNESPQRHNIRIMTVLSPYHTRGGVLIFCQRASQSREMCHACQRAMHTQGHDGRRESRKKAITGILWGKGGAKHGWTKGVLSLQWRHTQVRHKTLIKSHISFVF